MTRFTEDLIYCRMQFINDVSINYARMTVGGHKSSYSEQSESVEVRLQSRRVRRSFRLQTALPAQSEAAALVDPMNGDQGSRGSLHDKCRPQPS